MLLAIIVTLQVYVSAYDTERGLFSDESAHFLNGLLLRDYLRDGLGQDPMAFAKDYYAHYPKIAPLMWPPMFHISLGLFLLPGWPPQVAAIFLLGLFATWTAWRLSTIVSIFASRPVAVLAAVYFVTRPEIVQLASSVMVDLVIAAFAIEAAWWLARYADTLETRHAVWFGCFTAAACLTKGNGLSAVLMPLFLIALARRFDLLFKPGLYIAAIIVLVFAAPFLAIAYYLDPAEGDFGIPTWSLMAERLVFYSQHLASQISPAGLILAAVGIIATVMPDRTRPQPERQIGWTLISLVAGAVAFHLLSPHILSAERYMALALAPVIGLSALGLVRVAQALPSPRWRVAVPAVALASLAITTFPPHLLPPAQTPLGYRRVMNHLAEQNLLSAQSILVVSDEDGEGAAVAEVAVRHLEPKPTIVRGSKLLASDDWMGRNFHLRYATPTEVLNDLEAMHIGYVLLDSSPSAQRLGYWTQVRDALQAKPQHVELVFRQAAAEAGVERTLTLYHVKVKTPGPPVPLPQAKRTLF